MVETTSYADFSGGIRSDKYNAFGDNESVAIENLWCHTGQLRTMEGSVKWCGNVQGASAYSQIDDATGHGVQSLGEYIYKNARYIVAKTAEALWIGLESRMFVTGNTGTVLTISAGTYDKKILTNGEFVWDNGTYAYSAKSDDARQITISNPPSGWGPTPNEWITVVSWFPVIGDAASYLQKCPIATLGDATTVAARASMVQVEDCLYFAYNDFDSNLDFTVPANIAPFRMWRWSGFMYNTGKIHSTNGTSFHFDTSANAGVWGASAAGDFVAGGVKPGDALFVRTGAQASFDIDSGYIIKTVTATDITLTTTADVNHRTPIDYVIVRTHPAGLPVPPAIKMTKGVGTERPAGDWKYLAFWKDSSTGKYSNAVVPLEDGSLESHITLGANETTQFHLDVHTPDSLSADQLCIYGSRLDGSTWSPYGLLRTVERDTGELTFSGTYKVDAGDTPTVSGLHANYLYNGAPTYLCNLRVFNGRVWARGMWINRHKFYFSNYGDPDGWTTIAWNQKDEVSATPLIGGVVQLGDSPANPITGIEPEGGTFDKTGDVGNNLIIFFRDRAVRWYGFDWSDFTYRNALGVGCIADDSIQNIGGVFYWLGTDGLMSMVSGSNSTNTISEKLWPDGLRDKLVLNRSSELVSVLPWQTAKWNSFYCISNQSATGVWSLYMYNASNNSWVTNTNETQALCATAEGSLIAGLARQALPIKMFVVDSDYCNVMAYASSHYDTDYAAVKRRSGPLYFGSVHTTKTLLSLTAEIEWTASTDLSLNVYYDGNTTPIAIAAQSTWNNIGTRSFITWELGKLRGVSFDIEILSAEVVSPISIRSITIDWESGGTAKQFYSRTYPTRELT